MGISSFTGRLGNLVAPYTSLMVKYHCSVFVFLPRDAILARYMRSSCVRLSARPSVCHTPVL